MMNFRRLIQLTSSLAAALTLTACGGGDTGPQWAQDLKDTIVYGELPTGALYSPCSAVTISRPLSKVRIQVIEKTGGATYLTVKEEVYGDRGCSDSQKFYTLTYPKALLSYVGAGEDTTSGLTYQRVKSVSEGGNVQIDVVEGAPVTITQETPSSVRIYITEGDTLDFPQVAVIPAGTTGAELFGRDERSIYEEGDSGPLEEVEGLNFPTTLKTDLPYRPYRFISIAPGTYADGRASTPPSDPEDENILDCYTATLVGPDGDRDYGFITKLVVEPIDQDYRPQISVEFEYFADVNCNNRLVTIKFPPILLETVGNGIDPTLGVAYRQVLQLQQAGTITAIKAIPTDPRVTVVGNVVTFVDGGATIPIGPAPAETSLELMYFKDLTLYKGDRRSIDPATGFPTALETEFPFFLLD